MEEGSSINNIIIINEQRIRLADTMIRTITVSEVTDFNFLQLGLVEKKHLSYK